MDFEQLDVYKLSEQLGNEVWNVILKWKYFEKDTLGKEMTRPADSIAANIAEGTGRGSYQDNKRFVRMARASLYETKHWLRQAYRRQLISDESINTIKPVIDELGPRLNAYINSIGTAKQRTTDNKPMTSDK